MGLSSTFLQCSQIQAHCFISQLVTVCPYIAIYKTDTFFSSSQALSIVNLVQGTNSGDQREIDKNKTATLMNIGAVHMAVHDFGAAIGTLTEANELMPNHPKLLIRRARAFIGRGEFQKARADVDLVESFEYLDPREISAVQNEINKAEHAAFRAERAIAKAAFSG